MLGEGGVQQTTIKRRREAWKSGRSFRLLIEDQISTSRCNGYQKTQRFTPEKPYRTMDVKRNDTTTPSV